MAGEVPRARIREERRKRKKEEDELAKREKVDPEIQSLVPSYSPASSDVLKIGIQKGFREGGPRRVRPQASAGNAFKRFLEEGLECFYLVLKMI